YCAETFGDISAIAWLPDTFGFCWQLPQLLTQGGIRYFATQKLRWNDTNPFLHDLFTWQGRDGTEITGVTLPPIGTDINPVEMAQYACQWEASTGHTEALWLPGVGDHGGGPTRDMLLKARRWADSPFFPTLTFGHAVPLFDALIGPSPVKDGTLPQAVMNRDSTPDRSIAPRPDRGSGSRTMAQSGSRPTRPTLPNSSPSLPLPLWRDELYLELHRGCYTTHGDQKQYNRRCEDILFQAELFASIAAIHGLMSYPKPELETAWKQVLFNQFHDILPGSSIPAVFEQANQEWQAALDTGDRILQAALKALAQHCVTPASPHPDALPVVLFNPLNWSRSEMIKIALPSDQDLTDQASAQWQAQDTNGQPLPTQVNAADADSHPSLLVYVPEMPSVGYRLIWLVPREPAPASCFPDHWVLENEHLRVTLDPTTGQIVSLVHQATNTETFATQGNQLQLFQDQGQYWDAWNIAPDYQDHPLEHIQLKGIEWVEYGPVRQTVRVVYILNQSTITQCYCLAVGSPMLAMHTEVDWHETQVVLKVAFPLTVSASQATYEIPFGAIARSTTSTTPVEQAKWEVPALRWADLSDDDFGVSILTDYKHGFDVIPGQLRLTLLKAPLWPDPGADRGWQTFSYAIYPHTEGWQQAKTVQAARNLNLPIRAVLPETSLDSSDRLTAASWLDFGINSFVLTALKQAEASDHQYILRGYESTGTDCAFMLGNGMPIVVANPVNLLEQPHQLDEGHDQPLSVAPWQVLSLMVEADRT
ncbi:MAG: glycoside hydrolase family 38 C-terminal domain-containing protein, partial [Cyanobacteria bacterium J06638_6]